MSNDKDKLDGFAEQDTDELKETVAKRGKEAGQRAGHTLMLIPIFIINACLGVTGGIGAAIIGKLPKRTAVYRKFIKMGYQGMYEKTDAHMIANTIYGDGEMIPRPAELDSEKQQVKTSNGEEWTVENGVHPVRVGKAPVVTGGADDHELYDHVAARIAEAVDASPHNYQEVKRTPAGYKPVDSQAGGEAAMADGAGTIAQPASTFDDIWVDISGEEESDGMIISMQKAYEMHWDQGSSEEMQNQETRGILAAKDPAGANKKALMYVLLLLGGIALGLFGPALASQLAPSAGGAGGGGGGIAIALIPYL